MKERTMFWGLFFVGVGVLMLIQTILKIDLPVFRILLGLAVVYLGMKMVFGAFNIHMDGLRFEKVATANKAVFTDTDFHVKSETSGAMYQDFSTVFGESKLDLSTLSKDELSKRFEISTVFGKTEVITPKDVPLVVETNSAFGSVVVRGDKSAAIGNGTYKTPDFSNEKPHLKIEANSVFGSIEIR